jgi:excisionase family DNA binding protein
MTELLTVGEAAKILDRSADSVRAYAECGKLPVLRTQSGLRLFRFRDVDQLARDLRNAKEQRK